jgi:hypothetical protein
MKKEKIRKEGRKEGRKGNHEERDKKKVLTLKSRFRIISFSRKYLGPWKRPCLRR